MDDSTADGLRGAGALLAAASLALPWYHLHAGAEASAQLGGDVSLMSVSGWQALGDLHWLVLALALGAGLRLPQRLSIAWAPAFAAVGLMLVIGLRWTSPPSAGGLLADQLPRNTGLGPAFEQLIFGSFTQQLGLELRPASGLAVAAVGAAAALVGVMAQPAAVRRPHAAPGPLWRENGM